SATWKRPHTNRVLFEAGFGGTTLQWGSHARPGYNPALIQVTDIGANAFVPGIVYRQFTVANNWLQPLQARGSASYVTGTHTAKVGMQAQHIHYDDRDVRPNPLSYTFNNGVPNSLTLTAAPLKRLANIATAGVFAQDSW